MLLSWWAGAIWATASPGNPSRAWISLGGLAIAALAFIAPLVLLIFFITGAAKTFREWRRDRRHVTGKYNAAERAELALRAHHEHAWARAVTLRANLNARQAPPTIHVWDVVPQHNEVFFSDIAANYARFYGQNVTYTTSNGFFFGNPLFVAAGVALTAASNAGRRSAAEAAAREQWREHQPVRLIVSNQRLVCNVGGQWLSFYYSAMTAVYPEVANWTLVCQFDSTPPLLLHGADVPTAALITTLMTYGPDAIAEHPSLRPLGPIPSLER